MRNLRTNKFKRPPKGKDGEGRQVRLTTIMLSYDLVARLRLLRDCYAEVLGVKATYEMMLSRLMDNVKRLDPDVATLYVRRLAEGNADATVSDGEAMGTDGQQ